MDTAFHSEIHCTTSHNHKFRNVDRSGIFYVASSDRSNASRRTPKQSASLPLSPSDTRRAIPYPTLLTPIGQTSTRVTKIVSFSTLCPMTVASTIIIAQRECGRGQRPPPKGVPPFAPYVAHHSFPLVTRAGHLYHPPTSQALAR